MKNRLFPSTAALCTILLMIFSISAIAQPKIPDITGVKKVSVNLACKLTLIQGDKASLSITGNKEELEDVEVKLNGDELKIYNEDHHQQRKDITIVIALPDLERLSIGGAVDLVSSGVLKYDEIEIEVSGVADFNINLQTKKLNLEASGVISGSFRGETQDFKVEISGVGKLDATEFKAKNCKAEVSGVAKISVYVDERLEAEVSGMGKINYAGNPIIRSESSGIGKINKF